MRKLKTIIVSTFLGLILCLTAVIPNFFNISVSLPTRDVDVDNIGTLSYNEKVEELLSTFTTYSATAEDDMIYFEAEQELDLNAIAQLSFVSSTEDPVTVKYKTRLDVVNEKFYIVSEYIQNGIVVELIETETQPEYEEYSDDYYIVMPDGTKTSVKETFSQENLDECLVMTATATATAAYAAAALLAATIVVMAPTIIETVTVVITQVVSWIRSFFGWFRSLFTKKTTYVATTTTTITATPAITIAGTRVETIAKTRDEVMVLDPDYYYLCFADPTNGKMYFSVNEIDYNTALAIMMYPVLVPCIGNSNKDMVASVFCIYQAMAYNLAVAAGIANTLPENHGIGIGYYWHYHSVHTAWTRQGHYARPHAFYL